jgi:hypothetical protein
MQKTFCDEERHRLRVGGGQEKNRGRHCFASFTEEGRRHEWRGIRNHSGVAVVVGGETLWRGKRWRGEQSKKKKKLAACNNS